MSSTNCSKFNYSCTSGLLRLWLSSTNSSSTAAVLQDYSGSVVYYQFKSNGLLFRSFFVRVYLLSLFSNYLATNIQFLRLAYIILRLLSLKHQLISQNNLLLSLKLQLISQVILLLSPKLHHLSRIHHLLSRKHLVPKSNPSFVKSETSFS